MPTHDHLSLLREVFELLPAGVVFLGAEGRITLANSAAHALFCRAGERLVGRSRAYCVRRGIFTAEFLERLEASTAQTMYFLEADEEREIRLRKKRKRVHATYRPVALQGQYAGVLGLFEDSTAAADAAQLRDDLVHMMFHDMKQPLSTIMLNLDGVLLLGEEPLTAQQERFVATAKQKVEQLHQMLTKMVDINKLEQRSLRVTLVPFDMNDLVEGVLRETFALQFDKAGKRLLFSPSRRLVAVTADVNLIQRVVANLVDNGLKNTKEAGTVEVRTGLGPDRKSVVVSVRDQGPGVPHKFRHVIFEKYGQFRLRRKRDQSGVGLGLAFCKLAVETHGGTIGVKPCPGGGANFWFRLPCTPPPA